ncbi:NAD(P)/FAD-dependent oxidoreductase [Facilibium subflavum]|uniref:NAD(P)/FAD-dependent oxidoreductase n=1 Tax=Facilibium subflavum TaxID=2219058 RepID=UPI0013C2C59E|nr:NAD(P)/FAD-dependent oxidoreductase [Facilibium subflavum]
MNHYQVAVIGGGISGVSFAQKAANQGLSTVVIEKNNQLGGCIETIVSSKAPSFWLEMGAHTVYNSYHHLIAYCQQNRTINHLQKRQKQPFKLMSKDGCITSILSELNLIRAGVGWPLFNLIKANDKTVSQYFSFLFGQRNYQETLQYCFNAVLCQKSQNFPAEFLFKKRQKNKAYPRSFTFKNGMQSLFCHLDSKEYDLKLDHECHKICYRNGLWHIQTSKEDFYSEKLLLATPWHITQALLAQINHPIATLHYQPKKSIIHTAGIILDKSQTSHIKPLAGIIGVEQDFYAMVSRDVIDHPDYRGFSIHFHDINTPIQTLITHFLAKLAIKKTAVIDIHHKQNIVPMYHAKHKTFLDALYQLLHKESQLYLSGNYFTRLAMEDCVRQSHQEYDRLITNLSYE